MPDKVILNISGTSEGEFDLDKTGDCGFRKVGNQMLVRDPETGEHPLSDYLTGSSFDEKKIVTDRNSGNVVVDLLTGNVLMTV